MATEKQIAANKRNALKSTGPNTNDGKARSRMNALRHGLSAKGIEIGSASRGAKAKSIDQIYAELNQLKMLRVRLIASAYQLSNCDDSTAVLRAIRHTAALKRYETPLYVAAKKARKKSW